MPPVDVFDPPLTAAGINATWAGYVLGALEMLARPARWDGSPGQAIEALMAYLCI